MLYGTAICRSGRCRPGSAPSRCAGPLREIAETGDLVSENGKTYLVARVPERPLCDPQAAIASGSKNGCFWPIPALRQSERQRFGLAPFWDHKADIASTDL